jgi:uncharacterized protein (TIGR02646 family)
LSIENCTHKVCRTCGIKQPSENFSRDSKAKDGLLFRCKSCCKRYHQNNKERVRERWKAYKEANQDALRAYHRQHYAENKDAKKRYQADYRERNAETITEYQREWRKANAEKKKMQNARHRAQVLKAPGSHSEADIRRMYRDQDGLCAYCEIPLDGSFHVEHMQPLSRGGSNDWSNIAITCQGCNSRKHSKTVEEFFRGVAERLNAPVC